MIHAGKLYNIEFSLCLSLYSYRPSIGREPDVPFLSMYVHFWYFTVYSSHSLPYIVSHISNSAHHRWGTFICSHELCRIWTGGG